MKKLKAGKLLDKLSRSKDYIVRSNVANNPKTSEKTLEKLSKDKHYLVRSFVAVNPKTCEKVLKFLLNDPDKYVVASAMSSLVKLKNLESFK